MDNHNPSKPGPHPIAPHYQAFHREAEELTNSFHARLSDPFNPMAIMLKTEADNLVSDVAANKHPQEIEERIQAIQGQLRRLSDQDDTPVFSAENHQFFQQRYGSLRLQLQTMPGYDKPQDHHYASGQIEQRPTQEHPNHPPSQGWHPMQ